MTDRELLELAAKAAGLDDYVWQAGYGMVAYAGGSCAWNPLTDDGDALRLAVKLHISVEHPNPADLGGGYVTSSICKQRHRYLSLEETWFNVSPASDDCPGDLFDATRRAIVQAAAEIGKAMP